METAGASAVIGCSLDHSCFPGLNRRWSLWHHHDIIMTSPRFLHLGHFLPPLLHVFGNFRFSLFSLRLLHRLLPLLKNTTTTSATTKHSNNNFSNIEKRQQQLQHQLQQQQLKQQQLKQQQEMLRNWSEHHSWTVNIKNLNFKMFLLHFSLKKSQTINENCETEPPQKRSSVKTQKFSENSEVQVKVSVLH